MWGLGCVMYFLMYGCQPFSANNESALYQKIIRGDYLINTSKNTSLSQDCIDFMEKLLQPNKNNRYSVDQALDSDWISHGMMVRLKYLPIEITTQGFDAIKFYQDAPDILNYEETLSERL